MQSLYLLGIVLIIGALCFGSTIAQWNKEQTEEYSLNLRSYTISKPNEVIKEELQLTTLVPAILLACFVLNIIFSFKNRPKQIKLCRWNYALILLLLALTISNAFRNIPGFNFAEALKSSLFGVLLFVFMFYLNFRALMLIKRDENLVRSADRIR